MQMIITKIGCKIDQSCKIRCDVLIRDGVGEPSCSKNVPNSKMSIGLLGTAVKLETMSSCVTKIWAQLATDILLSRPLSNPYVASVLLPIIWPLVGSRLEPVLVILAVFVGMPIAMRTPPIATEIWVVMRHNEMGKEGCGVGSSGDYNNRDENSREGFVSIEWREFLCRNSWVRRWLWRSA